MININDSEQSDLDLGLGDFDLSNSEESIIEDLIEEKQLQRTDDWDAQRNGNWNASEVKKLCTCDQKFSKVSWNNKEKHFSFSAGAIKYIYKKAKERETKRTIKSASTMEMKYGTIIEDLTFRRADEFLRKKGLYLKKVGYKKFDDVPTAGASSDAIVLSLKDDSIIASGEMKACTSWETHFERTFENTDEKSIDFWQTQQQMLAWNVELNYYVVISPPSDIKKYIYSNDVMAMYDEWCDETEISIEVIKKSEIHCNALLKRIKIAEKTIERYLSEKTNLKDIFFEVLDEEKGIINNVVEADIQPSKIDLIKDGNINTQELEDIAEISEFEVEIQSEENQLTDIKSINELDDLPF